MSDALMSEICWDDAGLVAAIAQDAGNGRVLMQAWMNRDAVAETLSTGFATYWSRSRGRLWRKGERSGHRQRVREIRLDCDGDSLLLAVDQEGGIACHTGRESCYFRRAADDGWQVVDDVVKDPAEIYGE